MPPMPPIPPMPPMPPGPPGPPGGGSSLWGISLTVALQLSRSVATDAAFSSATRVTFAGSITPAATRSS